MEYHSEVKSVSQNDSVSSTASRTGHREETISSEEQMLLQLLRRGMLETTEENTALGKEISELLSKLNLEVQVLPNDIKDGLHKVALILRSQGLSDFDELTVSIRNDRIKVEEKRRQREERKLALMHEDLLQKHTAFFKKFDRLQEAVNSLQGSIDDAQKEDEDRSCNRDFLFTKLGEYQQTVEKLEESLMNMEIEELYPEKILHKYQKYLEVTGELAELKQFLSQYGDLPPNLLQAKALLEVKQKEYELLEKTFMEKTSRS